MEIVVNVWNHYLVHVADILLVSFLIYQMLLLMRGTRAVQISVGLFIIGLVTLFSGLLGFPTLSWLLQKFWIAGVVVIAILFQPEIRSALASLGAKTALRPVIQEEMRVINELVASVREGSRRQMGMLIVAERDTGLRNYIESGTVLNADVTSELILTLFQPPGVLHDGAVIVQGGRIAAAGCILPLSADPTLSKWLGTRHRAAVGITERSDAWAICVSEETGNISIAQNGKIDRIENADELRERLINIYHSIQSGPVNEPEPKS
jgi:diadenylate cyclase